MIDREDMLLLTRRMNVERTSIDRIAGAYIDPDGFVDGSFNIHFLKLKPSEKAKNLDIARAIPFAKTNEELKEYVFPKESMKPGSMWQLLRGILDSELKNDALLDIFYEQVGENFSASKDYALYVFHDNYDIPLKGKDKERLGESELCFEYIIVAIAPVFGDYEVGEPYCGFLYPGFSDGGAIMDTVYVFNKNGYSHPELVQKILKVKE